MKMKIKKKIQEDLPLKKEHLTPIIIDKQDNLNNNNNDITTIQTPQNKLGTFGMLKKNDPERFKEIQRKATEALRHKAKISQKLALVFKAKMQKNIAPALDDFLDELGLERTVENYLHITQILNVIQHRDTHAYLALMAYRYGKPAPRKDEDDKKDISIKSLLDEDLQKALEKQESEE